ncbi:MAG: non-ribosomal peptide synthetase, partial [Pyrinomonadaceae bacterium]
MTTSRPTERSYRLAPMQHGMLFHSLSAPDEGVYVVQISCELPPGVDRSAFNRAWQSVVNRHDVLRTCFLWEGLSEPLQKVCEDVPIQIDIQDWTGVPGAGEGGLLESYLLHERRRGFDLSTAPLMRFSIIKMAGDKDLFLWTYSHMLLDGRSRLEVMKEVSLFYEAYCSNQNLELPRPPAYADYIDWFYRQDLSDAEQYWRKVLGTFTTPVYVDLPRRSDESQSGDSRQTVHLNPSAEVNASLQRLAQSKKLTVNWIVQAAWGVLLARYSGQEDVVYGETRAGRRSDYEEVGSVVGVVMNTVPIRLQATGTKTFIELLQEVRDQHVQMRSHEGTPLIRIREASGINGRAELFQSMVMFEEYDSRATLQREGCALWRGAISRFSPVHYPLTLVGYGKPDPSIVLDYDRRVYSDESMERFAGHLTALLEGVVKDPHARIADLPLLTNAERKQIVYEWNATEADYPGDKCLHELFEEQVEQTPDAVAVVHEEARLSYGELNRRAERLAQHLRGLGVGPDARVAICVERCLEMVVGLLGIMKAGAAYVPLDPAYPPERLSYMVKDSAPSVVLTQTALVEVVNSVAGDKQVINIGKAAAFWKEQPVAEESQRNGVSPRNLAYLIYTSGSTGSPKGVAIEHRNASALIHWAMKVYPAEELDGVLAATSICFDLSVFELFVTLSRGGKVLLVQDALELAGMAQASEVTLVNTVPSAMAELVRTGAVPSSVSTVNLAGEPLASRLVDQLYEQKTIRRVIDLYGPSEATTYSTYGVRRPLGPATIGGPIANTQVYVLDSEMQPVPVGVTGELYIGGDGLARCYHDRAVATAEKWIPDPFSRRAGGRVYQTGDLGKWRADGSLEFVGRNDLQVKVRGYRIELGEIELALIGHEQVREAVVIAREVKAEQKQLVAYYTAETKIGAGELGAEQLREHLLARLPAYMVPVAYVRLEKMPLTPNGKLDRGGLPAPDSEAYIARGYEEPVGESERALAGIWREVLKVERVGRQDNFFELGGHSLLGMRFISQLRQALGVEVAISELFAHPDLAGFARVVERAAQSTLP